MANLMTGAEMVFKALEDQGVEHFWLSGGKFYFQFIMN